MYTFLNNKKRKQCSLKNTIVYLCTGRKKLYLIIIFNIIKDIKRGKKEVQKLGILYHTIYVLIMYLK